MFTVQIPAHLNFWKACTIALEYSPCFKKLDVQALISSTQAAVIQQQFKLDPFQVVSADDKNAWKFGETIDIS